MTTLQDSVPIPQPPTWPFVGNLLDINNTAPIDGPLTLLGKAWGEIYRIDVGGNAIIVAGSQKIVNELCDQERFEKKLFPSTIELRKIVSDALFTAHTEGEGWGAAHRILVPMFGPLSIRDMLPSMTDLAVQLVDKWDRFGDAEIDAYSDFRKITFDTIALCAFSLRINSFYTDTPHPFMEATARSLNTALSRNYRTPGTTLLGAHRAQDKQFREDIRYVHELSDGIIKDRETDEKQYDDLLEKMLKGKDPETGKGLDKINIRNQILTFLAAGHDTTAGLLAFLFYHLLTHADAYKRVRKEVDEICGLGQVTGKQIDKLTYLNACIKESIRLHPSANGFPVQPKFDTTLCGGKYQVKKGQTIVINLQMLHRDPKVWGDDVDDFRPERMLDGKFEGLPPNSWKPFGNGIRGCIGRLFALQETLLFTAMAFQRFDMRAHDPDYRLRVERRITVSPIGFKIHAVRRKDRQNLPSSRSSLINPVIVSTAQGSAGSVAAAKTKEERPMLSIFYGSNAGTCKRLAFELATEANHRNIRSNVATLNTLSSGNLPKDHPIAIITASYEGQPTDDAVAFVEMLKNAKEKDFDGVKYAVFGCGHPDWSTTFHAVPKMIDGKMTASGATRILDLSTVDVSSSTFFPNFDAWETGFLDKIGGNISTLAGNISSGNSLRVIVESGPRQKALHYEHFQSATVISNTLLGRSDSLKPKYSLVLELPPNTPYHCGDYIEVLPLVSSEIVSRVLRRFKLHPDDLLRFDGQGTAFNLPTGTTISTHDFFSSMVEPESPISLKQLQRLKLYTTESSKETCVIEWYLQPEVFQKEVAEKRLSLLRLLEEMPELEIKLGDFIAALPAMRTRQYSISSSPLLSPTTATLTFSTFTLHSAAPIATTNTDTTTTTTNPFTTIQGTASSYLSLLQPGDLVRCSIKPCGENGLKLPKDPQTGMVMIANGVGLGPFRGLLQERSLLKKSDTHLAPCILFYGCHALEEDALYTNELRQWQKEGIVDVKFAFSRDIEKSEGCRYAQDRLFLHRGEILPLLTSPKSNSAIDPAPPATMIYICGSSSLSQGVKDSLIKMCCEENGVNEEVGREWLSGIWAERVRVDVFG